MMETMTALTCETCEYYQIEHTDDAHCYMFREAPAELPCGQHTGHPRRTPAERRRELKKLALVIALSPLFDALPLKRPREEP